jgi:glycosyltransferase involved in cell wall biosynthesis
VRICLFDWNESGHHAEIAKAFERALHPGPDVILAAAETTLESIGAVRAETLSLGAARPRPAGAGGSGPTKSELAERELDLIAATVEKVKPDHLVLLWGEPVLRWLLRRPSLPTAVSIYVALSRLHYPRRYGTRFGAREWASAAFKELNLLRWARRSDSYAAFCIDGYAARRLSRYPGIDAHDLGEPPLSHFPDAVPPGEKSGCILFGHLDERKGVDRIAAAMESGCEGIGLKVFGEPAPEYRQQLEHELERMRKGGVLVDARLHRLPYAEAMEGIARSRTALLSFGWVPVGSRVLLEAAAAGTPVIGADRGAVGHLVRGNGLGLTVDPGDPAALRAAIQALAMDPGAPQRYAASLGAYSEKLSERRYRRKIRRAFGLSD